MDKQVDIEKKLEEAFKKAKPKKKRNYLFYSLFIAALTILTFQTLTIDTVRGSKQTPNTLVIYPVPAYDQIQNASYTAPLTNEYKVEFSTGCAFRRPITPNLIQEKKSTAI